MQDRHPGFENPKSQHLYWISEDSRGGMQDDSSDSNFDSSDSNFLCDMFLVLSPLLEVVKGHVQRFKYRAGKKTPRIN